MTSTKQRLCASCKRPLTGTPVPYAGGRRFICAACAAARRKCMQGVREVRERLRGR